MQWGGVIRNIGATDPKIQFYETIKEIEQRMGDSKISLDSFIISGTPSHTMRMLWGIDKAAMKQRHVLFQEEEAPCGAAYSQTDRVVQGLSLSGGELEDGTTGSGEGGVPCRGVVSAPGIHRDQSGDTESGGGAVLQQARDGGAVDQGRQAGGEDDAALLPSVPLKSSAAGIEPVGLQPGESVATAGVAPRNRKLVADEPAAKAGEDRRAAVEACALLLAIAGGRTSDAAAVRGDAGPDRATADTDGIGESWSSQQRNLCISCLGKERCCKSRPQVGYFWAVLVRMADRRECSR